MHILIRVRGRIHVQHSIKQALLLLQLTRVNHAVLVADDTATRGQIQKVRDYITYGKIDAKTLAKLLEKRGRFSAAKKLTLEAVKEKGFDSFSALAEALMQGKTSLKKLEVKPVFRLTPPRKGYERDGIKTSFAIGGALGNRKEAINVLVARMM